MSVELTMTASTIKSGIIDQFRLPSFNNDEERKAFYINLRNQKSLMRKCFMILGCVSFSLFGILDIYAGGEKYGLMIFARLSCVFVMAMVSIIFCLNSSNESAELDDILIVSYLCIPVLTIIAMSIISDAGTAADTYPFGLVILLAYGAALLNPRADYFIKLCAFSFASYVVTIPFSAISVSALVVNLFFMTFGMMALCIGSITRERLEHKQEIDSNALHELNINLAHSKEVALTARDEAILARKIQSNFIANLSHELRTPLNAILGFSGMMKAKIYGPLGSPQYDEYVDDIVWSGESLSLIINDLLDIQRLETGTITWSDNRFLINDMLLKAVRMNTPLASERNIVLDFQTAPMQFETIGDINRVSQAFANLITNAINYSKDGDTVRITQQFVPNGQYIIKISDNGIGISEADLERITKPFERVDDQSPEIASETTRLGLGLSIANAIFKRMPARLNIESKLGDGTECHVLIPSSNLFLETPVVQTQDQVVNSSKVVSLR